MIHCGRSRADDITVPLDCRTSRRRTPGPTPLSQWSQKRQSVGPREYSDRQTSRAFTWPAVKLERTRRKPRQARGHPRGQEQPPLKENPMITKLRRHPIRWCGLHLPTMYIWPCHERHTHSSCSPLTRKRANRDFSAQMLLILRIWAALGVQGCAATRRMLGQVNPLERRPPRTIAPARVPGLISMAPYALTSVAVQAPFRYRVSAAVLRVATTTAPRHRPFPVRV